MLTITEGAEELIGSLEYSTDLFDERTIQGLHRHFLTVLEGIAANPEKRLGELSLLTPDESDDLIVKRNLTAFAYAENTCVHQLFEAQAALTPEAIALVCGDEHLTYGELNRSANRLARRLMRSGVGPGVMVGIMWKLIYQPQAGVLNELLYRFHLPGANIDWLSDFTWALPAVILVGVWAGMPQTTIALLAGVQSISDDLHEAAAVDGATTWQRFRTITLPQLRPVIIAITSLDLIWNFNSFGLVYVLTLGGPGHSTELPMLFAYNEAFKFGEFGYASALGNAMVLVIAVVLSFYLWGRLKETDK